MQHLVGICRRPERFVEIKAKAEKVMEAAHDASMTTYDGKVNSIWLTKLHELGLR